MTEMTAEQFIKLYCERQDSTPEQLKATLQGQAERYSPDGLKRESLSYRLQIACQIIG